MKLRFFGGRTLIALFLLCLCNGLWARDPRLPAEIEWSDRSQLLELTNRGFIIEHPLKGKAEIWLAPEQFESLQKEGWRVQWIPDQAEQMWCSLRTKHAGKSRTLGNYHTYADLTAALQSLAAQYPALCRLMSIGKSHQGRDLWIMKISDNPDIEEAEPEIRLIGSMHGDEPVGMELLLNLIQYLLGNYEADARIQRLVDEEEIWILPLMNPDGYEASPPKRWNANGIDLNRDFPDIVTDPNNSIAGRQPETQAVMSFSAERSFVLSANFHGGALVTCYPLDSLVNHNETKCPDDDFFREAALTYSRENARMFASKDFLHGICVGADWYIVRGGIQDWTYHWMGGREIVVEMNEVKFPPESQLPTLWEETRASLLKFLEIGLKEGVRGYVRDGAGNPLAATILIGGRSQYNNHPLYLYTDPQVGDYYCFLRAGSYNLTFAVSGYESKSFNDVAVSAQIMTPLDVYFGTLPTPTPCAATNAWNLY